MGFSTANRPPRTWKIPDPARRIPGGNTQREPRAVQTPDDLPTKPRLDIWRKELIWAWNQALWDAPSKVLADGEPDPQLLLTTQLAPELNGVSKELIMVSAYFVPGQPGLVYLTGRADAGVSVRLLTNSLEATDVPAVHGGYAPYRKALLEHGVQLFELRRQPGEGGSGPNLFYSRSFAAPIPACTARRSSSTSRKPSSARSTSIRARCCGTPKSACWWTARSWRHTRGTGAARHGAALSYKAELEKARWSGSPRTTANCTP
jgi:putative cardiolipin synthase